MIFARLAAPLAEAFRKTVSGAVDGLPDWAKQMAEGTDEGLFGPDSAVWEVHGALSTLVGGIRALLLQAAHPAALAGVAEHSRYASDPVGRLIGTTRWLTITTFGATSVVTREAARVRAMHGRVVGTYRDRRDGEHPYAANDERLLLWVHCAFTDSFLKAHLRMGYPLTRGADRYVSEWRRSATALGLSEAPDSVAALEEELSRFRRNELWGTPTARRVVHFVMHPPFGWPARLFYRVLCNAAIATLEPVDRQLLGLPARSPLWLGAARVGLLGLKVILGHESPSQRLARGRIARLRQAR
jgi:uncharacterized protein (DUF2236 family)